MQILYLAEYKGEGLVRARAVSRNRHTGGSTKIERIAEAMSSLGHSVTIVSGGIVGNRSLRVHGGMAENLQCGAKVVYAPTIDIPIVSHWIALIGTLCLALKCRKQKWDCVVMYNLAFSQVWVVRMLRLFGSFPLIVEYEDDALISIDGQNAYHRWRGQRRLRSIRHMVKGAFVVQRALAEQLGVKDPELLLGTVDESEAALVSEIVESRCGSRGDSLPTLVYAGGLTSLKGVDLFLESLKYVETRCRVEITGDGPLLDSLRSMAESETRHQVTVHGAVDRVRLCEIIASANVFVNPHRTGLGHGQSLFPFKICEYANFGRPIVSSALVGLPSEMRSSIQFYGEDTAQSLANGIDKALASETALSAAAIDSQLYVQTQFGRSALVAAVKRQLAKATEESCS